VDFFLEIMDVLIIDLQPTRENSLDKSMGSPLVVTDLNYGSRKLHVMMG